MTKTHQLIKLDQDLSDEALAILQEQANTFPAVVTTEKEYKEIYDHHQKIKKIRLAVDKKSKELIKDEKKTFELNRANILAEETRIKSVLSPIEKTLLETRTAWEDEKERVKREKAEIEAKKQRAEFERQDRIREEIRLKAELEELRIEAYAENEKFDQHKAKIQQMIKEREEQKAELEELAKEREAFEAEKAEFEAKKLETLPIKTVPSAGASEQLYEYIDKKDDELLIKPQPVIITTDNVCTPEPKKLPLEDIVKNEFDRLDKERLEQALGVNKKVTHATSPDPDKPRFDKIFKVFHELEGIVKYYIEQGFIEPDSLEAAKYIKKELYLFWKNLHGRYDF